MAEPQLTPNASSSSSSHKRSYDAIGPEGGTNRSDVPPPGRSRRGSPTRSPSSAEGSRERNKRARNDRDSSYTSEVEDLLLSTGNPVSPSSSGSSRSSYHSAHSTLPTVTSPSLHDAAEDGMLVDPVFAEPVLPEPRPPSSASAVEPPWAETVLPVPHRRSPMSTSDAVTSRETRFHTFDEFRRSLERVNAFDREIAPLRSSPTAVPTTTSRNTGPLPPVQLPPGLDDELQARSPYVPDPAHAQFIDIDFDEPPREVWASSTHSGRANDPPASSNMNLAGRSALSNDRISDVHRQMSPMRDDWSQRAREISRARQRLVELHHTSPPMPSSSIQDVLSLESFRVGRRAYERNNTRPQGSRLQSGRTGARSQNDNAIFEDPLEHEDLLYILGTAISSQDDRLSRSPRNPPSLTSSRLLDMLGDRGTNSSSNNPYTSSQPGSSGPPAVRRSPRFSALSATMPTPPDEYLERTHERRMREVDRTVREAEVHRRRVVEFLAESVSPLPSYRHSLSSQGPELPIPTSSYSTLRHALGDNAEGERTRQEHRASDSDQVPALAIAPPLSPVSRESNIGSHAHSPWDVSDDLPYELPPGADAHEHMSDFARLPRRRGPFRARTAGEMAASGIDREPSPTRTNIHDTPPLPVYNDFAVSTLMEANARARSISLSGLRHRARPRSPSPPAPASPLPPRMVSTYGDYWGDQEEPSGPRYSPANRSYPPRRAEDNAMLQAFIDPPAPLRRPSPERAPFSNASRSTEDRVRPARYSNINLDAYREGPFRATLARSVALQNRRVISDNRSESLNPTYPYGWPRSIPAAGESLRNNLGGFDRRDASASTRRESRPDVPHDRLGTHSEVLDGHSEDELSNAWELEFFGPRTSALESRFDPPSVRATTPAAPPPLPMAPLLPPRVTPRGSLLSETRSSAVRDQTIGRPTLRHRTLLDREHASNSPWSDDPGTRTAAAAARLERVERHREMMHRVVTSRQAPIVAASPRPPTSMSRTAESSTDPSSTGTQLSMWTRRYNRHPLSTAYREGRAEDRQAPLNGRFARRGGLGQHYPPDMVWVDGPGRSAWSRRRNIGDYMRDEDFDVSYEGLLSLSSLLGDVKPRGTPADIIASLPKGTYGEWARPGTTEERCPICLDDYQPTDQCLRICDCSHWFHEGCLQQWLKGARTCPVCRGRVRKPPSEESSEPVAGPSGSNRRDRDRDREDDSDGEDGDDPRRRRRNPWMRPPWRHD